MTETNNVQEKTEIQEFFDTICERAKEIAGKEQAEPMCFALKHNNVAQIPMFFTNAEQKQMMAQMLRQIFRQMEPEAIVVVVEARKWVSDNKGDPEKLKNGGWRNLNIEDMKSKMKPVDILMATLHRKEGSVMRMWEIEIKGDKRKVLDKMDELKDGESEGLFDFKDIFQEPKVEVERDPMWR